MRLIKVEQILLNDLNLLYEPDRPLAQPIIETLDGSQFYPDINWRVTIHFKAPLRLLRKTPKIKGRAKKRLVRPEIMDFDLFFRSLLTRYSGLAIHFGQGAGNLGHTVWQENASAVEKVVSAANNLVLEKVRRYRRGNTRWIHLDGLMGDIVFDNVSASLLRYLKMGELMHIGKFPTMGYGEYEMRLQSD